MSMSEAVVSTGTASASALIKTGRFKVHSITLTPAAAVATLTVYDALSATGTAIETISAAANGSSTYIEFNSPVELSTGLYAAVTGTGATFSFTISKC